MLTTEQIKKNKEEFINLLRSIKREGANIDGLIEHLEKSDFFYAPASSKYHGAFEGGLCQHCLNVYRNLLKISKSDSWTNMDPECYDDASLVIVALLHDISKMNFYEPYIQNKKVYAEAGSKQDEFGRFDWVAVKLFKVRDQKFVLSSHEANAEYIARQYIPLKIEESAAILNHMGRLANDSAQVNISEIYENYHLALILHIADLMATFIDERAFN